MTENPHKYPEYSENLMAMEVHRVASEESRDRVERVIRSVESLAGSLAMVASGIQEVAHNTRCIRRSLQQEETHNDR